MKPEIKEGIIVLSLFDGMSCGQQALEKIGVNISEYYASEIDKHAIAVTMHNYPNTKQLGSVVDIDGYKLPRIDLLIGGSPCQSFSFAGKRKGMTTKCETEILTLEHYLELKSEGYEFEGQSYLFWEYMRLLKEVKPKYFLLENVIMGEKWEKILSKAIGVKPIEINSALVSAQNRRRLYWTNIGMKPHGLFGDLESIIQQPKDKGILLKEILELNVDDKYYLSSQKIEVMLKSERSAGYTNSAEIQCVAMRGREAVLTPKRTEYGKSIRKDYEAGNNGKYCSDGSIGKILEIGNEERKFEQIYCECEESFDWFFKDNYFPIPLTKEWLIKFGFKINRVTKEENNIWRKEWTEGYFELEEIISFFFGHPVYSTEIKTVDHLQNLFFFVTNEELSVTV